MKIRTLFAKDLRVLLRSPRVLLLLAIYPALVALLIGLAVGRPPDKPKVAVYNEIPKSERSFKIGGKRFNIDKFVKVIYRNVDVQNVDSRAAAIQSVRSGESVAAVIIPKELVDQLKSPLESGSIEAIYDNSDAVRRSYVETQVKGLLVDTNRELTNRFSDVALDYLGVINKGGTLKFGVVEYKVGGLKKAQKTIASAAAYAPPAQQTDLQDLAKSIGTAELGLNFADDLLNRIGEPIKLKNTPLGSAGTIPVFALAVAVAVSLMFVALLLGAGMLAYEQEDRMLSRLMRGLASAGQVVTEKTFVAGLCAFVMGVLMLLGFAFFIDIRFDRAIYWLPTLALSAIGFGVAGVAIGAITADVRAASLLSFMVGLPMAVAALVPSGSVSPALYDAFQAISALFPFKPALELIQSSLSPDRDFLLPLTHLLLISLIYGIIARVGLQRNRAAF
ncbi:MAG: ABC transporter permease [Thermoleophilaceae bacterium]|nr:ABC transporter permease [Thermoleophilaceae bacterium]